MEDFCVEDKGGSAAGYSVLGKLADGAFGDILKVCSNTDNQEYAAKVMCLEAENIVNKAVRSEVDALFQLRHESIILVKEVFVDRTGANVWLVMELADLGNIEDYVATSGMLSDAAIISFITQLSRGMEHIHSHHYAHCDVTPRNLLIFSSALLKISDFGQCVQWQSDDQTYQRTDMLGDPRYMAPEVLRGSKHDPKLADVWSVGCCLYFMFTSRHLYDGAESDIKRCQMKGKIFFPGQEFYYAKYNRLRKLMSLLVQYDPSSRPAFGQWSPDELIVGGMSVN